MLQLKLYRTQDTTPPELKGFDTVYHFDGNPGILGIGFNPNRDDLRALSLKAAGQRLSPVLLGAETYLHLFDVADQTGLLLGSITIEPTLDEDGECELSDHVSQVRSGWGTGPLKAFLMHIGSDLGAMIRAATFLVDTKPGNTVKVTVHNNGVLYVNGDDDALPFLDPALSMLASYRPGHQQP
jgi:hypothetical protein